MGESDTTCAACGASNDPASPFCARCTAPLAVVALAELTEADRKTCLAALFRVLAETSETPAAERGAAYDGELWRAYLSGFWLRPETALVLYAEAMAVRKFISGIRDSKFAPSLDLGCGDGIHAAIRSGWRFDPGFDAFQFLDLSAADIYHHWDAAEFRVEIAARGDAIDYGFDIKPTAVSRAEALGIFGQVRRADATDLPLPDASVGMIFSNMLRDLGDSLPAALRECRRVMAPGGTLLMSAMTPAYARHLYFTEAAREADAAGDKSRARELLRLDRGRSVFCRRQLSIEEWESLYSAAGLKLVAVEQIVGPAVIRFWDVGLRPFAIALLEQRRVWQEAGMLPAMKSASVELISRALDPLVRDPAAGEACMHLLAVGKA